MDVDARGGLVRRLSTAYLTRLEEARRRAAPTIAELDESLPGQWYSRMLELEIIDRSVALASKLFVAFFPFVLGIASLMPDSVAHSIRNELVRRFGLSGQSLQVVAGAFAETGQTRAATGIVGGVLLFFYATSFTTALQRIYLRTWRRPASGNVRNQLRGLSWLAGVLVVIAVNAFIARVLVGQVGGALRIALGVVTSTGLWWWTAHTMLRGEVRWRPLLPGAAVTAVATLVYALSSNAWMPRIVQSNSSQFGFFGVALSLVSWFVGVSFVMVASATLCPVLVEDESEIARWLCGRERDPLVPGAAPSLPGPTRRLRLIDALGVRGLLESSSDPAQTGDEP